jgi:HK97 family phage portal protein
LFGLSNIFSAGRKAREITTSRDLLKHMNQANSFAGVSVTPLRAMQQATVFSSEKVRAETFAQCSPVIYERLADGGKRRADNHWMAKLLRERPGEGYTPFEFFEKVSMDLDLRGDHFSYMIRAGDEVKEFIPLMPDQVERKRNPDTRKMEYRVQGLEVKGKDVFGSKEILHVRDLSIDGVNGLSKISQCRHSIGLTMACERHGATVFKNGAAPSGIMEFPNELTDPQHKRLQKDLDENWNGLKANRTMILESGGKFSVVSVANKDAQYLETRQFQRSEICGIFRVPPHMIGDQSRSTFNNIEHLSLDFIKFGTVPELRRFESAVNCGILYGTPFYLEFLVDSLVRGDLKSRMESYGKAIQTGIMTPNEVRAKENLEADDYGNDLLMMANVVPLRLAGQTPAPPTIEQAVVVEDEAPPEEPSDELNPEGERDAV